MDNTLTKQFMFSLWTQLFYYQYQWFSDELIPISNKFQIQKCGKILGGEVALSFGYYWLPLQILQVSELKLTKSEEKEIILNFSLWNRHRGYQASRWGRGTFNRRRVSNHGRTPSNNRKARMFEITRSRCSIHQRQLPWEVSKRHKLHI